ncbi:MAG: cytochrome c [Longimicrobiales bacterium]
MSRKRATLTLASVTLLALLTAGSAVRGGWYDVGADTPHPRVVEKVLRYAMERSVRSHAQDVEIPEDISLTDTALAERAAGHYSVVCADCHAAPGQPQAPWMVLYPPPADLTRSDVVDAWSDRELYWIIKHGIGDTGMTAMAPGHGDEDVWAVAAFVRQLPAMTPERYRALVAEFEASQAQGGHGGGHAGGNTSSEHGH